MTVMTLEKAILLDPILEPIPQPEIFTLPPEEIDCILAEIATRPKTPVAPCLIEGVSEGFSDEPTTEYQDSLDASGYPYW